MGIAEKISGREVIALGLTLSRLFAAEAMQRRVKRQESITGLMALFLAIDEADGLLARKLGVDTPLRRTTDALVDRISIFKVANAISQVNHAARPYVHMLAVRDVIVGTANLMHHACSGETVHGKGIHTLGSLSVAGFGLAAANGNKYLTHVSGGISTLVYGALGTDYVWNVIQPHGTVDGNIRHIAFDK